MGKPNIGNRALFHDLIEGMLDRAWLSNQGPLVEEFERRIEQYIGVRNCICVCNATIGLQIALRALKVTGEVILPSFTFVATAHAVEWLGLKPVFADIDPRTHNLDPGSVRNALSPRTSAILGVHLWGRPAPHEVLKAIASEHNLALIYDAAHALGASLGRRMIGNFGDCEVFSFHATKFFNTLEGGAIVTNDDELADLCRKLRNFGFVDFDDVQSEGTNGKMTEACAAMGLANIGSIDEFIAVNRRNHRTYREVLERFRGLKVLRFDDNESGNYQHLVVEVGREFPLTRDALLETLRAENVLARKYFWPGCHRMGHYARNPEYSNLQLPNTELVSERILLLPTGPQMGDSGIEAIATIIDASLAGSA